MVLAILSPTTCYAEQWEIGGLGAYGWYHDATITTPARSESIGMAPKGAMGVVFAEDPYKYIGGEVRWLYIFGQPQIRVGGIELTRPGFSNVVHYDLIIHVTPQEAKLRPFFAVGGGVRVYSVRDRRDFNRPLFPCESRKSQNEAEALISAGGGLKYIVTHSLQVRMDFRTYLTPTPTDLFRPIGPSFTRGWIYNFVPSLGVSYLF
jgi:hypothetical protein